ncbi:MAG TPA: hypothetical protein VFT74_10190 [Isosphaeraceae bacterium]|nr:hypothetical protein [Isosphaeraceae bacterium]
MKTRHAMGWVVAGVAVLAVGLGSASKASAQGFFGLSTPGFSMSVGSGGYYPGAYYPGSYYGAYPRVVPPVVVAPPVVVQRPVIIPGGGYGYGGRGYGYPYGGRGYGHGYNHHGHHGGHHGGYGRW